MSATFAFILAQAAPAAATTTTATTTAASGTGSTPANDPNAAGSGFSLFMFPVMLALLYFAFMRPQSQAKKKQAELLKAAKTGDRVITTSGIHGVITNVKDSTVMVKVADNVKLEVEKTHIDKIVRTDAAEPEKIVVTKS
jgi:preprotein translocase subunit YajC